MGGFRIPTKFNVIGKKVNRYSWFCKWRDIDLFIKSKSEEDLESRKSDFLR